MGGGTDYVALTSPGRSLTSSYEILRHTFSILKENSPFAVIVVQKKNLQSGYTAFDIPIFNLSPTSIKRLGLEDMKKRSGWLFFYYPVKSLQLLFDRKSRYPEEMRDIPQEIEMFCEERGINLRIVLR